MLIRDFRELWIIIGQSFLLFLLFFLLYKKFIFSIFDPLFFFLITQAFSVELSILTLNSLYFLHIIFCELFFFLGFIVLAPSKRKFKHIEIGHLLKVTSSSLEYLNVFLNISLIIIIISNIYLFSQSGIILLAKDPSESKVTTFSEGGGLGVVRRINWGVLYFSGLISVFLYLKTNKTSYLIKFLIIIFVSSLSGSKGALLFYIQALPFFAILYKGKSVFNKIKKLIYVLIPVSCALVLYILFTISKDVDATFFALGYRFLYFGDAILFYYDQYSLKHFTSYSMLNFLWDELSSPLALFRLTNYEIPLGYKLVMFRENINTIPVFGPNVPFYVKGHIYFGYFGALLYSFSLGIIVGYLRRYFYLLLMRLKESVTSIFAFVFIIFINLLLFGIAQDSTLFFGTLFDTIIFSIPILVLTYIFLYPKRLLSEYSH
ncbi:O-antigen polymerase [Parasediminibacterium paludis]|uniref:O-antigen polymerase n=1 Tax=Parasediminibacterium paludis TaxID=908966 RepID=A0ABV8Q0S0_9BACT